MALKQLEPSVLDDGESTVFTVATPPETIVTDSHKSDGLSDNKHSSSVPWPGYTFLIRSVSSGHLLTLRNGKIMLAPPGGRGTIHWACEEKKGWLGFRDTASGKFLGHNIHGNLVCDRDWHLGWENFCARMTPEGGYVLLMTHWDRLWHVGPRVGRGEMLAKLADGVAGGMVWEFIKV